MVEIRHQGIYVTPFFEKLCLAGMNESDMVWIEIAFLSVTKFVHHKNVSFEIRNKLIGDICVQLGMFPTEIESTPCSA